MLSLVFLGFALDFGKERIYPNIPQTSFKSTNILPLSIVYNLTPVKHREKLGDVFFPYFWPLAVGILTSSLRIQIMQQNSDLEPDSEVWSSFSDQISEQHSQAKTWNACIKNTKPCIRFFKRATPMVEQKLTLPRPARFSTSFLARFLTRVFGPQTQLCSFYRGETYNLCRFFYGDGKSQICRFHGRFLHYTLKRRFYVQSMGKSFKIH